MYLYIIMYLYRNAIDEDCLQMLQVHLGKYGKFNMEPLDPPLMSFRKLPSFWFGSPPAAYYGPSITIFQRIRPSNEFEGKLAGFVGMTSVGETPKKCNDTVDGRNPAPPGMYKIV